MCSPRRRRPRLHLPVALLLCAASLAQAAISGDEIRVGLMLDTRGPYAHFAGKGSEAAARMAIEDVGGKVAGRPIRLAVEDHGGDVEQARRIAQRWLDEEGIDVIADVVGSPQALAVQEVNRSRGAVAFYNGAMTSALTGVQCSATGVQWMYDGYAFSTVLGRELTQLGGRRWYFVEVDNAFGSNVDQDLTSIIEASGGAVVGRVRHPRGEEQLFAKLRQASESGADVIALINAGQDVIRSVRQAFDLLRVSQGQTVLAAVATTVNDVHLMKPELAQGLHLAHAFYWNLDRDTRRWARRFYSRTGAMPNDLQAGIYSALIHYFKAVAATGSDDGPTVVARMRQLPISDPVVRNARLRPDGRMVHDVYLLQVKKPSEVKEPWDYLKLLKVVPGDTAFRPLAGSDCPLLKK